MAARFSSNTVRSVGALLPSDVLAKAFAGFGLEGLDDADYGLGEDVRLRDAVNDAWNEARSLWWAFQSELRDLPADDQTATSLTRDRWLLPLLHLLGFEGVELQKKALSVSGTEYPISHRWNGTPLHLVGARVDLDGRIAGIPGAARLSPHSLLQQFLNRSDDHLWGVGSDGRWLRILRDSVSLTRQAFVEFDLEALFNGDVFPDFILLYRVAHATRFEADRPEQCLLERWIAAARHEGIRALDQLRDGVETALVALGSGFLHHPGNGSLRTEAETGDLKDTDLYRYLLRLVYRLLFLFVSEDRDLLLMPGTSPEVRARYSDYYSSHRLRELASVAVTPGQSDLWPGLVVLMGILGRDRGEPALGLPGLGSFLWDESAIGPLVNCSLANEDLASAVRSLSFVRDGEAIRRIDFAGLGAEELGSVYESLLELHPHIDPSERRFTLGEGAGSERKATGSYYTPIELISELLDSALDPVLEDAASKPDPETAILELKVVDPAAGSGHFLVAAAHRIAKRLAEVRSGEPEPPADAYRTAVRNVVSRCIYAVDMNELAVELCKVSLWLEALEPGKPLSFLDHHILRGNSLVGATPARITDGIPDEAFVALTGDDKITVSHLKKRNRQERVGQHGFEFAFDGLKAIESELITLEGFDDNDLQSVRAKERLLASWKTSPQYRHALLVADSWCSAFSLVKTADSPTLTEASFKSLRDEGAVDPALADQIETLSRRQGFFHWHLAFPQVFRPAEAIDSTGTGWEGGFDIVLGNPPWERVTLKEEEWFAVRAPKIASAAKAADRKAMIAKLGESGDPLYREFLEARRGAESVSHFLRQSGRYPLTGRGDVNTYAVFSELMTQVSKQAGRVGMVVPTGIATDHTTRGFFADLVERAVLTSLFDFQNVNLFPGVGHGVMHFSLLTIGPAHAMEFAFFARSVQDLLKPGRKFSMDKEDFYRLNPNTATCPIFRNSEQAQLVMSAYRRLPILRRISPSVDEWGISFHRVFDMARDSGLFRTRNELEDDGWVLQGNSFVRGSDRHLPLYVAKMVHHFNHRYRDYSLKDDSKRGHNLPDVPVSRLEDARYEPLPQYWVSQAECESRLTDVEEGWLVGFRDICRNTDERTMIASALPRTGAGHTLPILVSATSPRLRACLVAVLSSFVLDFVARSKIGGSHMSFFIVEQFAVPSPDRFKDATPWDERQLLEEWIGDRVAELAVTSTQLAPMGVDLGVGSSPFVWDVTRRAILRAELDAAMFHLFGYDEQMVDYIMDTFPVLARREKATLGQYRSKGAVLNVHRQLSRAMKSSVAYETKLDPPPADPSLRVDTETHR